MLQGDPKQVENKDIVIVDDIPDNLRLLSRILKKEGYRVRPAPSGKRALATIEKEPPEVILLDIMMPEMDGYEVCRRIKANERTRDILVIFLSALNEVFDKVKALQVGGVDYISKPFQVEEILVRVNTHLTIRLQQKALALQNEELKTKNRLITEQAEKLKKLACSDPLTGISNRKDFLHKADEEKIRLERSGKPFSIILLDIDKFKVINDTYGHDYGDKVLVSVARTMENSLRKQDIVARWGGEEFICLLPETSIAGGGHAAEKIRVSVKNSRQQYGDIAVSVTVTLGISLTVPARLRSA